MDAFESAKAVEMVSIIGDGFGSKRESGCLIIRRWNWVVKSATTDCQGKQSLLFLVIFASH
jgi:hypothetical protein